MKARSSNIYILYGLLIQIAALIGLAVPLAASTKYGVSWWIGGPIALCVVVAALLASRHVDRMRDAAAGTAPRQ